MNNSPVVKRVLYAGQRYVPMADGSKAHFHFQTWKISGKERVLIDDSKKIGNKEPMALVIGHKFKLDVWEHVVKMMAVGEVSSFVVKKEFVFSYPFISKTLREVGQDPKFKKHLCTMNLQTEGIGYRDLDDLIKNPCDLEFIIELLKVEKKNEYEREIWQMNVLERLDYIPVLKEKGNKLYSEKKYAEAESVYGQALAICEQLMIRERKDDEEWINLNKIKLPILLNYAQCRLVSGDFYAVIDYCSTILQYDKENEKALFRRAKAHIGAWNPDAAERDFNKLKTLNPSLARTVDRELDYIKRLRQEKAEIDKKKLNKLFDEKEEN